MLDYMLVPKSKDDEKTIYICDPQYGEGGLTAYLPAEGISVFYSDFLMESPYKYPGEYNQTNVIEINYCLSGKYECEFSDQTVIYLSDGDFSVWSGKGAVIASDSSYKRYKGITIYVDMDKAEASIRQLLGNERIDLLACVNETLSGKTCIIAKPGEKIRHIFDELYDLPTKYALDYIRIKVCELLLLVYTGGFKYEESGIRHYPRKLVQSTKDTQRYIENNFSEHITIADLARRSYINDNQLMECFKYIYGMTIGECIQRTRMTKAIELLVSTDLKVADISLLVGYSNASKFAETFKRFYQTTPVKYRRENGTKIKTALEHF